MGDQPLNSDRGSQSSFRKLFDEAFPYYLAIGMSYEQFWFERPELVIAYRKADKIAKQRKNEELWLQGIYISHSLNATVGNMFSKKSRKVEYPKKPLPIFEDEAEARREKEQQIKMEKAKAGMMAFAERFNTRMHSDAPQEVSTSGNGN